MQETEYDVLFIDSLTPVLKNMVVTERHDLLEFQQDHCSSHPETIALSNLHAPGIFKSLSAIVAPISHLLSVAPLKSRTSNSAP